LRQALCDSEGGQADVEAGASAPPSLRPGQWAATAPANFTIQKGGINIPPLVLWTTTEN